MQTGTQKKSPDGHYPGTELELFRDAVNWKRTLRRHIQPYLSGDVLEVGAGIGGTTETLRSGQEASWTCLEPDPRLAEIILQTNLPVVVKTGTVADLPPGQVYDTIIYIDVLEHIEDDRLEVAQASSRLKPGGRIVILCPAHPFLFSSFDEAIGHFRRYTRRALRNLSTPELREVRSRYLDSAGFFASLVNRYWLSQPMPSASQIMLWDRLLVRSSRLLDPMTGYRLGKSVLMIWQKAGASGSHG